VNIGHIATDVGNAGNAYCVTVTGNFAYVADFDGGLRVYNVFNPANPFQVGYLNNGGLARGVAVSGNYAFLANGDDGLRADLLLPILNLSPTTTNTFVLSWPAPSTGFVLQHNTAFGSTNWVNVTNAPSVISNWNQTVPSPSNASHFYRLRHP
jgi:hypothetical protein